MSQITVGKVIIDFPDSHKDFAEGLKDAITEELSDKSLQDKAIKVSMQRTEIANEVNTQWTPINLKEDKS
jgi:hypothetical protein|tara:strand:- start:1351 stop:1560 length:210 start_codon:yes stop_codon:yes gene_type:complete